MSGKTGIEWTDVTWNPIRGCSRVSEGCRNCYAEKIAHRFSGPGLPYEGLVHSAVRLTQLDRMGKWNGNIAFDEKALLQPLKWKKPRMVFVNSMGDLFHENVTDEMRDRIFAVMALCPQHMFQVLTKRPERMLEYLDSIEAWNRISYVASAMNTGRDYVFVSAGDGALFIPNVWMGVSVENQKAADERIPLLLQTPAAVRFISAEPLLGALNLDHIPSQENPYWYSTCLTEQNIWWNEDGQISDGPFHGKLDWVICGGESGPGARPMHPDWARGLRDQCVAAGVPFFFKQWGEWGPYRSDQNQYGSKTLVQTAHGYKKRCALRSINPGGTSAYMQRVGKKAAGRLLDGAAWRQMPR